MSLNLVSKICPSFCPIFFCWKFCLDLYRKLCTVLLHYLKMWLWRFILLLPNCRLKFFRIIKKNFFADKFNIFIITFDFKSRFSNSFEAKKNVFDSFCFVFTYFHFIKINQFEQIWYSLLQVFHKNVNKNLYGYKNVD